MQRVFVAFGLLALVGCGKKADDVQLAPSGSASSESKAPLPGINHEKKPSTKEDEPEYVDVGQWSTVGDVRIGVFGAKIGKPFVVTGLGDDHAVEHKDEFLQLSLNVENLSKTKKLEYFAPSRAILVDEHGNDYRQREFSSFLFLRDGVQLGKTLYPGDKSISDVICFQIPVAAATNLKLTLRSPVTEEKRKHGFRIPSTAWKK